MNAIATRIAEFETRRAGLRSLNRKNVVANFTAYWPGENTKGVSSEMLIVAILQAETHPELPLSPSVTSKNTATWGKAK